MSGARPKAGFHIAICGASSSLVNNAVGAPTQCNVMPCAPQPRPTTRASARAPSHAVAYAARPVSPVSAAVRGALAASGVRFTAITVADYDIYRPESRVDLPRS